MKPLALLLALLLLFIASAYVATAQTLGVTVEVVIPCSQANMIKSKCVPDHMWEMPITICGV